MAKGNKKTIMPVTPETAKTDWKELTYHSYSEVFPMMSDEQIDILAKDIKKNGQQEPIWIYQGEGVDGRNRHRAFLKLDRDEPGKYEPKMQEFFGTDEAAQAFVISQNYFRRHLTHEAKIKFANDLLVRNPQKSNRDIAKWADLSHTTVGNIREEAESLGQIVQVTERQGSDSKTYKKAGAKPRASAPTSPVERFFKSFDKFIEKEATEEDFRELKSRIEKVLNDRFPPVEGMLAASDNMQESI